MNVYLGFGDLRAPAAATGSSKRRGGEATSTASYYLQAITYALDP